ncbi:MAG: PGPGW domain-containing protein [Gammaproteobacteria bacterium]|nr:PGPGW domain-containing protein [Gammaproteobacteria bacterium]MDH5322847.1 PGPGW domain-containing protein [Gammaproteobacteria bacterium]
MIKSAFDITYKIARRITVAVVGSTVLAVGLALIVLPGPAIIVIPVGLAILGLEFTWARIWLKKLRRSISGQGVAAPAESAEQHRNRTSNPDR